MPVGFARFIHWFLGTLCLLCFVAAMVLERGDFSAPAPTLARELLIVLLCLWVLSLLQVRGGPSLKEQSHGTARWALKRDLRGLLRPRGGELPAGTLALGLVGRQELVLPPRQAAQHTLLVGPPGSGKTRGWMLPNAARATGSIVVTDPKGELWRLTSGGRAEAWRYAPGDPAGSRCFNWIPLCADDRLADLLAAALLGTHARGRVSDPFWAQSERLVLAALFAHTSTLAVPTPASLAALGATGPAGILEAFRGSRAPRAQEAVSVLEGVRPETRAGIVLGVANRLDFLRDPRVARFTSASTEPPDFAALGQRAIALYWCLPEQDVLRLQGLSSLFFTLLLDQLSQAALDEEQPVLFLLDEFANLGPLPNFAGTIAVARGRGLGLVVGLQALSQLDALYGRDDAATIRGACGTSILLHGLQYQDAAAVSAALGDRTISFEATSQAPGLTGGRGSHEQVAGRALLTADEVRRLDPRQAVVLIGHLPAVLVRRHQWRDQQASAPAAVAPLGPPLSWTLPTEGPVPPPSDFREWKRRQAGA